MLLFLLGTSTAIVTLLWGCAVYASTTSAISYVLGIVFVFCWTALAYTFTRHQCSSELHPLQEELYGDSGTYSSGMSSP